MKHLSEEVKKSIIKKVLNNNGQTLAEIAHASNIGKSILNKWMKSFRTGGRLATHEKSAQVPSTLLSERFKHLQATFGKESATVRAYCRQHGLYPHQLTQLGSRLYGSAYITSATPVCWRTERITCGNQVAKTHYCAQG